MNHRPQRMGSLILTTLNELILREIEVPNALITLTGVTPSKDLLYARVGISVLPKEKEAEAMKTLNAAKNSLQRQLIRKLNLKPIPEITFELDLGLERAAGIEKALLDQDTKEN